MKTLFKKTGLLQSIELSRENGMVSFRENTIWGKKVYQVPVGYVSHSAAFSRTYHVPFMAMCLYFFYQGIKLVWLRIGTDHWTLYLGIFVVALVVLIGLYYAFIGWKYGLVTVHIGQEAINLSMKESAYREFQDKLSNTAA